MAEHSTWPGPLDWNDMEAVEKIIERKKTFLGNLVLDNFHLFGKEERNIIFSAYWKQYRERPEKLIELIQVVEDEKKRLSQ